MRIPRLTIKNYGRIENQEIKLGKVDVIGTPYIEEISSALSEIIYSDYLRPNLPRIVTTDKSFIGCKILAYGEKIRLEITFLDGEPIKKYYVNNEEVQNINEELPIKANSFEQEMTSLFLNRYKFQNCNNFLLNVDYKNYFAFYKGSRDKILPSSEFSYLYGEKFFRSLLNNYIRTFKLIWINKDKGIYIKLLNTGEFNSYKLINGKEEEYNLSEMEQTVFNFIVFLEIDRFWGELNRIKDLNFESKPLIAIDLMEHLDISFDALKYIKDLKQNRQIIILKEIR